MARVLALASGLTLQLVAMAGPAFADSAGNKEKRETSLTAFSIGYCLVNQKLLKTDKDGSELAVAWAEAHGVSREELVAFARQPDFLADQAKVQARLGGCRKIAADYLVEAFKWSKPR